MGCWNQTCAVSNLPIMYGDEVVVLPVIATSHIGLCGGTTCETTDCYAPLSMALYGEYNDYGSIENIKVSKLNEEFLMQLETYQEAENSDLKEEDLINAYAKSQFKDMSTIIGKLLNEVKKERTKWETIQDLVDALTYNGILINYRKNTKNQNGEYRTVAYMMIHKKLYEAMISDVSKRIPYGKDKSYRELYKEKILKYIGNVRTQRAKYEEELKNATDEQARKLIEIQNMLDGYPFNNHAEKLGITDILTPSIGYNYLIEKLIEQDNDEVVDEILDSIIFNRALSLARRGYLVDTGLGSQSEEYQIHRVIAEFVESHIQDVIKKRKEDEELDEECPIEEYLTETLFWWDKE